MYGIVHVSDIMHDWDSIAMADGYDTESLVDSEVGVTINGY